MIRISDPYGADHARRTLPTSNPIAHLKSRAEPYSPRSFSWRAASMVYRDGVGPRDPSALPWHRFAPGTRVGQFLILRRIASGGMGELHLAVGTGATGCDKLCVIKRVRPDLADDPAFTEMLLAEAKMAVALDHANIVQVVSVEEEDGVRFLVMEFVHGEDVGKIQRAAPVGKIGLDVGLSIVIDAARGLHYAHERSDLNGRPLGLVHRDVSPSNILVGYDGGVKVVDFGVAKAWSSSYKTVTGTIRGKVSYMSPEQCRGDAIDRRSDIFSLGIVLFEITTGNRLFRSDNPFATMNLIELGRYSRPTDVEPSYPAALEEIVMRALRHDPAERYATAEAMQIALEDFAHAQAIRLSTTRVAAYLRSLFGDAPYPTVSGVLDATTIGVFDTSRDRTSSSSSAIRARARRRKQRVVFAVGAGFMLTVATWTGMSSLARTPKSGHADVPDDAVSAPAIDAESGPPSSRAASEPASAAVSNQQTRAVPMTKPLDPPLLHREPMRVRSGVDSPESHSSSKQRRPSKKKSSRPRAKAARPAEPVAPPTSIRPLFPPSRRHVDDPAR